MTRAASLIALVLAACTEPNPDYCPPEHFAECERAYFTARGWVKAPDLAGFEVVPIRDMAMARDTSVAVDMAQAADLANEPDLAAPPDMMPAPDLWFDRACVGQTCKAGCFHQPDWTCCALGGNEFYAVRSLRFSCIDASDCKGGCALVRDCVNGMCCSMKGETCSDPSECCSGKAVNHVCS